MTQQDTDKQARTPTWVKVFGFGALILVLLIVAMLVLGGGHGPSRHSQAGSFVALASAGPSLVASLP